MGVALLSRMTLLLVLSLLANVLFVLLGLWGWRSGHQDLAERLYLAPNRDRRRSFFDHHPIEPRDVVVVGDSLTAGAQWTEMFPGVTIKNRGIGGDTTATVLDRIGQVTAGRPETVLLMVGTNDLATGVPHERILSNYAAILDRLRADAPETAVVVQSVLPRAPAFAERVRALNAALARLAAARDCAFLDLTPAFAGPDGAIRPDLSNDALHLLGPGYVAWRSAVAPYVLGTAASPARRPRLTPKAGS
jgi:lysophospholipase L1-like esterase